MVHVDRYYDMLEGQKLVNKRRVFLATDEMDIIREAKTK